MQEKFYTINEVMLLLQVAKLTVYRYIKNWKLKAYKIWKEFRISQNDLEEFMEKSKFTPTK